LLPKSDISAFLTAPRAPNWGSFVFALGKDEAAN
jgi:hypothetical protein